MVRGTWIATLTPPKKRFVRNAEDAADAWLSLCDPDWESFQIDGKLAKWRGSLRPDSKATTEY
jgi:hypothetical protein